MSAFDETKIRRQGAGSASGGQFAPKANSAPGAVLTAPTPSEDERTRADRVLNEAVAAYRDAPSDAADVNLHRASVAAIRSRIVPSIKSIDFEWGEDGGLIVADFVEDDRTPGVVMTIDDWADIDFYASNIRSPRDAGFKYVLGSNSRYRMEMTHNPIEPR